MRPLSRSLSQSLRSLSLPISLTAPLSLLFSTTRLRIRPPLFPAPPPHVTTFASGALPAGRCPLALLPFSLAPFFLNPVSRSVGPSTTVGRPCATPRRATIHPSMASSPPSPDVPRHRACSALTLGRLDLQQRAPTRTGMHVLSLFFLLCKTKHWYPNLIYWAICIQNRSKLV